MGSENRLVNFGSVGHGEEDKWLDERGTEMEVAEIRRKKKSRIERKKKK
jgi:hypothetical protein